MLGSKPGRLTIDDINGRGGGSFDYAAISRLESAIIVCMESTGMLASRVSSWLEPPVKQRGAAELWLFVEVPMPDTKAATGLPKSLQPILPEQAK
jgi:hypothetical protein